MLCGEENEGLMKNELRRIIPRRRIGGVRFVLGYINDSIVVSAGQ